MPVYFRINTIKTGVDEAKNFLRQEGVEFQDTIIPELIKVVHHNHKRPLLSYHLGYIYPQALSSCMPVLALDPRPGEMVLDMCAAPGGKATYIAQRMEDTGFVVANDRKRGRITSLLANVKRLGITNTLVTQARGEHLDLPYKFDKVLVDAPCSGQGKYRIDPVSGTLKHVVKGKTDLSAIQKALIKRAFDTLKPGGILVYSTCTLSVEENEEVVDFLLNRRRAKLLALELPIDFSPGITQFKGKKYNEQLELTGRFYPHRIDSVGFFVAKIAKDGTEAPAS
ncbi:MAG: RsmB/NOP family class I SAM-dependent RNA methyltransferase [Thermodesulfobacteria bacterium]|nr:RsmB/NOP family class I SAM-dependent RNA methyltransferase [Thermodesulfobacteriota bacterium]